MSQITFIDEAPGTVHGRLLEATHLSGHAATRAKAQLNWLLDDGRWRDLGFEDGEAFVKSVYALFDGHRWVVEDRAELSRKLAAVASQRSAAKVLGVGHATVQRDLGGPDEPAKTKVAAKAPSKPKASTGPDEPPKVSAADKQAAQQRVDEGLSPNLAEAVTFITGDEPDEAASVADDDSYSPPWGEIGPFDWCLAEVHRITLTAIHELRPDQRDLLLGHLRIVLDQITDSETKRRAA